MLFKFCFFIFISTNIFANIYIGSEYGYSQYNSNTTEQYNLNSKGTDYSLILGKAIQFIGLEIYYKSNNSIAPIIHESLNYNRVEKSKTYGLNLRINLEYTYLKIGYALNNQVGIIQNSQGEQINDDKINSIYETSSKNNSTTSGLSYGFGLQYRWNKSLRFTLGYECLKTGRDNENYQQINLGIIFKLPEISPNLTE
jgi:opacity protein-like surface antigen